MAIFNSKLLVYVWTSPSLKELVEGNMFRKPHISCLKPPDENFPNKTNGRWTKLGYIGILARRWCYLVILHCSSIQNVVGVFYPKLQIWLCVKILLLGGINIHYPAVAIYWMTSSHLWNKANYWDSYPKSKPSLQWGRSEVVIMI